MRADASLETAKVLTFLRAKGMLGGSHCERFKISSGLPGVTGAAGQGLRREEREGRGERTRAALMQTLSMLSIFDNIPKLSIFESPGHHRLRLPGERHVLSAGARMGCSLGRSRPCLQG